MPSGGAAIKWFAANRAKAARIMRIAGRNLHEHKLLREDRRGQGQPACSIFPRNLSQNNVMIGPARERSQEEMALHEKKQIRASSGFIAALLLVFLNLVNALVGHWHYQGLGCT